MRKTTRFSWRGLAPQLLLVVVLPLVILLLGVTFGGLALHRQAMRQMVGERDVRAAEAAANALGEQISHRLRLVQSLAQQVEGDLAREELAALLQKSSYLRTEFDGGLAFFSADGELLAADPGPFSWSAVPWWEPGGSEPVYSELVWPVEEGSEPVMFAAAQDATGKVMAVGAFYTLRLAEETLEHLIPHHGGGEVFLISQKGQLIYRAGDPLEGSDLAVHPGVAEALEGKSGAIFLPLDSNEHVAAYSPVPEVGWALVVEEPWESVTSPMLRLTEQAPLVLIPVVLVAFLALWFGANRIVQPLRLLEARAARLGWGDYEAITEPVGGISEIRHLQGELTHLANKVRAAQQGLRDYIGAMTAGQEEERRRLARELHDDTLQALIALNQRLQLLRLNLDQRAAAGQAAGGQVVGGRTMDASGAPGPAGGGEVLSALTGEVDELQELAEATIRDLRRLTRDLRPIYLEDLGLATALEMLAREASQPETLVVEYRQQGQITRLAPQVELALYRMAQEALSNVARHARATRATLSLVFEPDRLQLGIQDNGQGFVVPESPAAFAPGGHFGLLGLYERAEMIGARLDIQSVPGRGTRVNVILHRSAI